MEEERQRLYARLDQEAQQARQQAVGGAPGQVAKHGPHRHGALHAQVQTAGFLHHDLPHGAIEQGGVYQDDIEEEQRQHIDWVVHFTASFLRTSLKRVKKSAASTVKRMTPWSRLAKLASIEG